MKLSQVIAIENQLKTKCEKAETEAHHSLEKSELLTGLTRVYTPLDEKGEPLPTERKLVQIRAKEIIALMSDSVEKFFDIAITKEFANCSASADIVIGDKTLLSAVPVGALLFLEKKLTNLATFIRKLPVVDPAEEWTFDAERNCYATEAIKQVRTKKIPRNHVKAEATEKHPAQVEVYNEDVQVGTYQVTKFSGALTQKEVTEMISRVESLMVAVKVAREQANMNDAPKKEIGKQILDFLFLGKS